MSAPAPIDAAVLAEAERWFAELMAPEQAPERQAAFVAWLQADPVHRRAYREVEGIWERLAEAVHTPEVLSLPEASAPMPMPMPVQARHRSRVAPPPHPVLSTLQFRSRARQAPPPRRWWPGPRTAVLAACLAALGLLSPWRPSSPAEVLQSAIGESRSATLADGSVITLDTDSRVSVAFDAGRRTVVLEQGAAFFDVTPDAARPFVVRTRAGTTTVLGTQFQVRQVGERVQVLLVKGALRLDEDGRDVPGVALKPGQQATRTPRSHWQLAAADPDATAWREGRLVFRNTPLAQAVAEVNRYTRRRLQLGDPSLASLTASGVFRIGDPDSFVLALENSLPVRSRPEGDGRVLVWE